MSSAWGLSWGFAQGSGGGGSGSGAGVTLLSKLKTILDQCTAFYPIVPVYYYRELPEGTVYPKLDIEGSVETTDQQTIAPDGPEVVNAYFKIILIGETAIGPLEDIMQIISLWLHPRVFALNEVGGGSGTVLGDPVLFKSQYTTEQLPDRSPNGKPLIKLTMPYRLLFGGSF